MNDDDRLATNRRTALKTIGASTLALAGCLSGGDGDADVRIGSPWDANRDPLDGGHTLRRLGITEALVGVDYEANPAPGLATGWERLDDHNWRFSLREGVTFHDGASLDGAAVVESLRRTIESTAFADVPIETVEATDEMTVAVETGIPFAPLPAHLSRNEAVILSPDAVADGDGTITEPISTGPFVFDSFHTGSKLRAVRNDEYYGRLPEIESVRYEIVEDDQTRRMKLESGALEMARILPAEMVGSLESAADIDVYTPEIPRIRFLTFDTKSVPFDDERVRRAVNYAIDRAVICDSLLEGVDEPAVGPFPASVTEWANPDLEGYTHDPDRARSLLSAAGWTVGSNDDVRTRDGGSLSIEFTTFDARSLPLIAEAVQTQLGRVGFDVDVTTMEYNAMLDEVTQEPFDGYLTSWGMLWYPDPDRLAELVHSRETTLHHGYENGRVDSLLEEARERTDREERRERYDEIQSIVLEEAPVAFLTNYTNVVATASELGGYRPHPTENRYGLESIELESE
ncbi:ABC transporter substrate-binding protein [Natrinema salaciae]|uniref:Peptide/nickel transport system substrate-binding protein n=1 Tax=Natrinema salaciae TaxID=1186196 RepID=A0A1H9ASB3_9EURY|nr:ABC transporter substrate-binding protein [Natrinema salaciae]SEP79646.1 peptide/nickel transport system substrate-binding protein [Natrinema salaciae]